MADRFIGYNRGADLSPDAATVGSSTGSTTVELRWTVTSGMTRQEITLMTEAILRRLNDGRDANTGL